MLTFLGCSRVQSCQPVNIASSSIINLFLNHCMIPSILLEACACPLFAALFGCLQYIDLHCREQLINVMACFMGGSRRLVSCTKRLGMNLSRSGRVWVLDGGLGTELEKKGFDINDDPLWSARVLHSDPQAILDVHKSFLLSGADIIITASYQISFDGLSKELGFTEDEALNLIGRSVALATEACQWYISHHMKEETHRPRPLVAGSVGPYGAWQHNLSEYSGEYVDHMTKEQLKDWHRPRVATLLSRGVDVLAVETIPALAEAEAVLELLGEFPGAQAWLSFTCKDGLHTCHGELFSEVVSLLAGRKGLLGVGINCTDPDLLEPLLRSAAGVTDKPFIVYPNSGEKLDFEQRVWTGHSRSLAVDTRKWVELGARIVGGCCQVGPQQIQEIRQAVDSINSLTSS